MNPNSLQILTRLVRGRGWRLIPFERFVHIHDGSHDSLCGTLSSSLKEELDKWRLHENMQ